MNSRVYTVWLDVPVPDMDEVTAHEVLSSVLLQALRESNLTVKRIAIEEAE